MSLIYRGRSQFQHQVVDDIGGDLVAVFENQDAAMFYIEQAERLTVMCARAEAAERDSKIQRAIAQQLAGYVGKLEHDLRLLPWDQLAVLLEQADANAPAVDAFNRLWNASRPLPEVQP